MIASNKAIETAERRARQDKKIDKTYLMNFIDSMASCLAAFEGDGNVTELDSQIESLSRFASSCYANGEYKKKQPERSFELGVIYGVCELFACLKGQDERRLFDEMRQSAVVKHGEILRVVRDNPGITHGELAAKCDKSKSRLSQIVSSVQDYRLLTTSTLGKTKHYYLSQEAKRMLRDESEEPEGKRQTTALDRTTPSVLFVLSNGRQSTRDAGGDRKGKRTGFDSHEYRVRKTLIREVKEDLEISEPICSYKMKHYAYSVEVYEESLQVGASDLPWCRLLEEPSPKSTLGSTGKRMIQESSGLEIARTLIYCKSNQDGLVRAK